VSASITTNYRDGIRVIQPLVSVSRFGSRAIVTGLPSPDEENYWINEEDSPVSTDEGLLTIIDDIIFYWEDDGGGLVCDDLGSTVELLHINN
jgi:hypothetical protein